MVAEGFVLNDGITDCVSCTTHFPADESYINSLTRTGYPAGDADASDRK